LKIFNIFSKIPQILDFIKIRELGAEFHAVGQLEGRTIGGTDIRRDMKLVAFANASRNHSHSVRGRKSEEEVSGIFIHDVDLGTDKISVENVSTNLSGTDQ
jgi:hypothetical protein